MAFAGFVLGAVQYFSFAYWSVWTKETDERGGGERGDLDPKWEGLEPYQALTVKTIQYLNPSSRVQTSAYHGCAFAHCHL